MYDGAVIYVDTVVSQQGDLASQVGTLSSDLATDGTTAVNDIVTATDTLIDDIVTEVTVTKKDAFDLVASDTA